MRRSRHRMPRAASVVGAVFTALLVSASGCYELAGYGDLGFSTPFNAPLTGSTVERIDMLFVIDESPSTREVVDVLEGTLERLFDRLLNPPCVDSAGLELEAASPLESCPLGSQRAFEPVLDIHVGVITSSLGSYGAGTCLGDDGNRKAHLFVSEAGCGGQGGGGGSASADGLPYLAWDAVGADHPATSAERQAFTNRLVDTICALDSKGCGFEAQHEAWYRFLVEPNPHDEVVLDEDRMAQLLGTDEQLLAERAAFLRDDSLVAIVVLSDENDCSMRAGGQFYLAAQSHIPDTTTPFHLPAPRDACAVDPAGPCCKSCGQDVDDACKTGEDECCPPGATECPVTLGPQQDNLNVRCFDQKRRFGIDFLQPIERYVAGLTQAQISDRHGNVVANPLLASRDPGFVVLTAIIGVPWQDIARQNKEGEPDLKAGRDVSGQPVGGFQGATELVRHDTWALILGDPGRSPPGDPLMIESIEPRSGVNPVTKEAIEPPDGGGWNSVNGHEYSNAMRNDLQYACIFELNSERDCTDPEVEICDCLHASNDLPLCQKNPSGAFETTQYFGPAYPGIRHLQLLRAIGSQGVVGSVCYKHLDPQEPDYGYNPALLRGIIDRLGPTLRAQHCTDRPIAPVVARGVACRVLEARTEDFVGNCGCTTFPRRQLDDELLELVNGDPLFAQVPRDCICEIDQVTERSGDREACQQQVDEPVVHKTDGNLVHGWCYIDAESDPPVGDSALAAGCPAGKRHLVRFVGNALPAPQANLFIACK